jgi:dephospho-CoA kinase
MSPFKLGLTGSIGMGKSTTAGFFAKAGIAVWDADAAVHRLYASGGAGAAAIARHFPQALIHGAVDRGMLKQIIAADQTALPQIETLIHPLVAADRLDFLRTATSDIVVLDIPLLFEKVTERDLDATLLVTAPREVQRARVLARPGMTPAQFEAILARQMPDRDKRGRATHIIETLSLASVSACVTALIDHIRGQSDA